MVVYCWSGAHYQDIGHLNVQISPKAKQNEIEIGVTGATPVLRLEVKIMTKDEFCHKWVGHIRYADRDDRDQLWEEMYCRRNPKNID